MVRPPVIGNLGFRVWGLGLELHRYNGKYNGNYSYIGCIKYIYIQGYIGSKLVRVCPGQGKMAGSAASPSPEPGYAFAGACSIVSCAQSSKLLSSKLFFLWIHCFYYIR